jgi:hypothetical protein
MRFLLVLFLAAAAPLYSHVGSPDVFYEGMAGPYRLLVTIRPPQVVPGVAEIELRADNPDVESIHISPLRLATSAQYSPVPDVAQRSKEDRQYFTGALWLMTTGNWKVLVQVDGKLGKGELAVPVPALSTRVLGMQKTLSLVLIPLGLVLVFGLAGIVAASVREGQLPAGAAPDPRRVRRSRILMVCTLAGAGVVTYLGNTWWTAEAGDYSRILYKPMSVAANVSGNLLSLKLVEPGWLDRTTDDLLRDHGHLMHLYVVNLPAMDRAWHLHPERDPDSGIFVQKLPAMPPGRYALYGDIVHAHGLAETVTTQLDLPAIQGSPLTGDDAGNDHEPAGGYHVVWENNSEPIHSRRPQEFRFRLIDAKGQEPQDIELYMGMLGHAAFIKDDGTVFAHVHPSGSVAAAALGLAMPQNEHAMHMMTRTALPAQVSFPYGLPKPGRYRIVVQMKHGGEIVTGLFNANVEN